MIGEVCGGSESLLNLGVSMEKIVAMVVENNVGLHC